MSLGSLKSGACQIPVLFKAVASECTYLLSALVFGRLT